MKLNNDICRILHGKKLLIFDFDGTIADTTPLHAQAFAEVLAPYEITVDYPVIAGMKTRDAMIQLIGAVSAASRLNLLNDQQITALVAAKQSRVRMLIKNQLHPIPAMNSFLQWVRPRYQLAMYSSGSFGTVSLAMKKLGYVGWFDPLLCAEDVVHAKPDPEGFLKVLVMTGFVADDALVFEDSDAGIEAAQRAGIMTADVRIKPFNELQKIQT